jgi:hypothetical protein
VWCFVAGAGKLRLGSEEEAVAWLRRSVDTNRSFPGSHFYLAAALAEGRASADLTVTRLVRNLPTVWAEQEKQFGFA